MTTVVNPVNTNGAPATHGQKAPLWKSARDRALALGGERERVPTGITALDTATRGGFHLGRVVIVGGAPGSFKTGTLCCCAMTIAQTGIQVGLLAYDEAADGLLVRVGQILGHDREALESGREATRTELACQVDSLPLLLVDGPDQDVFVEDVAAELARRAGGEPAVLFVDSLQTARTARRPEVEGPRARVDVMMAVLRRCATTHRIAVVATSELSRGAYRSRDTRDRIDDLAAFKESGGIEYGADLALVLRNVVGNAHVVDVTIAKNRLGSRDSFRLKFDEGRASFSEASAEDPFDEMMREATDDRRANATRKRVLDAITSHPGLVSKSAVAAAAKGRRTDMLGTLDVLISEGAVEKTSDGYRVVMKKGV